MKLRLTSLIGGLREGVSALRSYGKRDRELTAVIGYYDCIYTSFGGQYRVLDHGLAKNIPGELRTYRYGLNTLDHNRQLRDLS